MNNESGFIALISAIIISVALLTIVVALNFTGFLGRFNILDSEFKERSVNLAEACVDAALLNIADNPDYVPAGGGDAVLVIQGGSCPDDCCTIVSVASPVGGTQTIKTKATFQKAITNLEIVANSGDLSIVSWKECVIDSGPCN